MKKTIDCLFIGHNEMDFAEYEKTIRRMGKNAGAYRDLNLNFIRYNNRPLTIPEIFNVFYYQDEEQDKNKDINTSTSAKFFNVAESFSAAIAYLGTYLNRRGYTFDYVNAFLYSRAELSKKLASENILSIAIITTLYVSELPIIEIIEFIRTYNRTAKIIVGGPFVSTRVRTMAPEELEYLFEFTIGADFYINSSQGEAALVNIINALKNNRPLHEINNIYYKTSTGIQSTPVLRENNRLSENMVDWRLFADHVGEYVNVRTAISCPFACSFCGFPQHAGQYQTAGVEEIEKELKALDKIKTVKSLHFIDDTFNIPVQRFKDLLRMMIKNKFRFKWHSYFRCQFVDKEMVELLKESGCEGVFLGIESGNNQMLKNMNKNADTQKYLEGIELLNKYGIVTFGNFIIGFPGETEQTVQDTVHFIKKSGLDFFRTQLWYCEPITPIWKERDRYKLKGERFEWSHSTMDSQRACDFIEEILLDVKESIWVPQYNFDFDNLWHLTHRGMSINQVKKFLERFTLALKEKLIEISRDEVSYEVLKQIRHACSRCEIVEPLSDKKNPIIDQSEAGFDFL
jgi:radical SAM PhpK family P-methyltransferase